MEVRCAQNSPLQAYKRMCASVQHGERRVSPQQASGPLPFRVSSLMHASRQTSQSQHKSCSACCGCSSSSLSCEAAGLGQVPLLSLLADCASLPPAHKCSCNRQLLRCAHRAAFSRTACWHSVSAPWSRHLSSACSLSSQTLGAPAGPGTAGSRAGRWSRAGGRVPRPWYT